MVCYFNYFEENARRIIHVFSRTRGRKPGTRIIYIHKFASISGEMALQDTFL